MASAPARGRRIIMPMSLLERIAYHESGHAVACIVFGIPIIDVNINSARLHRDDYRAPLVNFGIDAMTTLCMAGPEAERLFCGSCSDEGDVAQARQILARVIGGWSRHR
jgi:hypothetical protein